VADDCAAQRWDERAAVKQVIDGDTIELGDGRHVRFIGVNAPEVAHEDRAAEPFAEDARAAVERDVAHDKTVLLRYDAERLDVHQRTLAHVYRADGRSVEAELLARGLAFAIAIPPNLTDVDCYHAKEREARVAKRAIWSAQYYAPIAADRVTSDHLGFRRVQGRIERVGQSKKSIWLNLAKNVALRIDRDDLKYFGVARPDTWRGRSIVARGWMTQYKNGEFVMRARHPAAIESIE
jgi:endonuclease YncB( thermonuclease family)